MSASTAKTPSIQMQGWILPVIFTTGFLSGILLESRLLSQIAPDSTQILSQTDPNGSTSGGAAGAGTRAGSSGEIAANPARQIHGPLLVVDEREFDFGTRDEGESIEHEYILRNLGTTPLIISQIGLDCGWVSAHLEDRIVQPGTSAKLAVFARLQGRKGRQKQSLVLASNDSQSPEYPLSITGSVSDSAKSTR
jgi:hypothetical protein